MGVSAKPLQRSAKRTNLNIPFIPHGVRYLALFSGLFVGCFFSLRLSLTLPPRVVQEESPMLLAPPQVSPSSTLLESSSTKLPRLSVDWGNFQVLSPLAQDMVSHQANCSLPLADFRFRNRFGLGSDLHLWSVAMCNAMEAGYRVVTRQSDWIYNDQQVCPSSSASALTCYFPTAELQCPSDASSAAVSTNHPVLYRGRGRISWNCSSLQTKYTTSQIESAAVEVLFSGVSLDRVVATARKQVLDIFGPSGAPSNLILCHIRWGDKADEMKLVDISEYIRAVEELSSIGSTSSDPSMETNVFLATEDPKAVEAFRRNAPPHWNIFVDEYLKVFRKHRQSTYNGHALLAKQLHGQPGRVALASLLVAMEARSFVLTTASNWSRLMNELRRSIVEPRRGPTRMVDLRPS